MQLHETPEHVAAASPTKSYLPWADLQGLSPEQSAFQRTHPAVRHQVLNWLSGMGHQQAFNSLIGVHHAQGQVDRLRAQQGRPSPYAHPAKAQPYLNPMDTTMRMPRVADNRKLGDCYRQAYRGLMNAPDGWTMMHGDMLSPLDRRSGGPYPNGHAVLFDPEGNLHDPVMGAKWPNGVWQHVYNFQPGARTFTKDEARQEALDREGIAGPWHETQTDYDQFGKQAAAISDESEAHAVVEASRQRGDDIPTVLEELRRRGFLFHGSPTNFETIEPHQANDTSKPGGNLNAVYMSEIPMESLFAALTGKTSSSGFGTSKDDSGRLSYDDVHLAADEVKNGGFVYVIPKAAHFALQDGDWTSDKPVRPALKLPVSRSDLPYDIETPNGINCCSAVGEVHIAAAIPDESGLKAAGIAVIAMDTGRVLMQQRALNPMMCPCGMGVTWDEMNGYQHDDGSVSHDGEFYGQSVSDLLDQGHPEEYNSEDDIGLDQGISNPNDHGNIDGDEVIDKEANWFEERKPAILQPDEHEIGYMPDDENDEDPMWSRIVDPEHPTLMNPSGDEFMALKPMFDAGPEHNYLPSTGRLCEDCYMLRGDKYPHQDDHFEYLGHKPMETPRYVGKIVATDHDHIDKASKVGTFGTNWGAFDLEGLESAGQNGISLTNLHRNAQENSSTYPLHMVSQSHSGLDQGVFKYNDHGFIDTGGFDKTAALECDPNEGTWEFPGGKLDEGESPRAAAAREFREEVGQDLPPGVFVGAWVSPGGISVAAGFGKIAVQPGDQSYGFQDISGGHTAPVRGEEGNRNTLDNMDDIMPDYVEHPEYYNHGNEGEWEAHSKAVKARGNPDKKIRIYRAVPHGISKIYGNTELSQMFPDQDPTNLSEWVSTSKEYAQSHALAEKCPKCKGHLQIVSGIARAGDLVNEGYPTEFGYVGDRTLDHTGSNRIYKTKCPAPRAPREPQRKPWTPRNPQPGHYMGSLVSLADYQSQPPKEDLDWLNGHGSYMGWKADTGFGNDSTFWARNMPNGTQHFMIWSPMSKTWGGDVVNGEGQSLLGSRVPSFESARAAHHGLNIVQDVGGVEKQREKLRTEQAPESFQGYNPASTVEHVTTPYGVKHDLFQRLNGVIIHEAISPIIPIPEEHEQQLLATGWQPRHPDKSDDIYPDFTKVSPTTGVHHQISWNRGGSGAWMYDATVPDDEGNTFGGYRVVNKTDPRRTFHGIRSIPLTGGPEEVNQTAKQFERDYMVGGPHENGIIHHFQPSAEKEVMWQRSPMAFERTRRGDPLAGTHPEHDVSYHDFDPMTHEYDEAREDPIGGIEKLNSVQREAEYQPPFGDTMDCRSGPSNPLPGHYQGAAGAWWDDPSQSRWQQGDCLAYAKALTELDSSLKFGTAGYTELGDGDVSGGWVPQHHFAHDDANYYDSLGSHPLSDLNSPSTDEHKGLRDAPYDHVELDGHPDDWDETSPEDVSAAKAHAVEHGVIKRVAAADDLPREAAVDKTAIYQPPFGDAMDFQNLGWTKIDPGSNHQWEKRTPGFLHEAVYDQDEKSPTGYSWRVNSLGDNQLIGDMDSYHLTPQDVENHTRQAEKDWYKSGLSKGEFAAPGSKTRPVMIPSEDDKKNGNLEDYRRAKPLLMHEMSPKHYLHPMQRLNGQSSNYEYEHIEPSVDGWSQRSHILSASKDGKYAGSLSWSPEDGEIDRFFVEPEHRRTGLSKELWQKAKEVDPNVTASFMTNKGRRFFEHNSASTKAPVYKCFIYLIQSEKDIDLTAREHANPDDPDGDMTEQSAWWEIEHAKKNPALRIEVKKGTPWGELELWADKSVRNNRQIKEAFVKLATAQTPSQQAAQKWLDENPEEFSHWNGSSDSATGRFNTSTGEELTPSTEAADQWNHQNSRLQENGFRYVSPENPTMAGFFYRDSRSAPGMGQRITAPSSWEPYWKVHQGPARGYGHSDSVVGMHQNLEDAIVNADHQDTRLVREAGTFPPAQKAFPLIRDLITAGRPEFSLREPDQVPVEQSDQITGNERPTYYQERTADPRTPQIHAIRDSVSKGYTFLAPVTHNTTGEDGWLRGITTNDPSSWGFHQEGDLDNAIAGRRPGFANPQSAEERYTRGYARGTAPGDVEGDVPLDEEGHQVVEPRRDFWKEPEGMYSWDFDWDKPGEHPLIKQDEPWWKVS